MERWIPMGNYIGVEPDKQKDTTEAGLFVSDTLKSNSRTGTVTSLPDRTKLNEEFWKDDKYIGLSVGDRVLYYNNSGTKHENYLFLKISELIAKWEK